MSKEDKALQKLLATMAGLQRSTEDRNPQEVSIAQSAHAQALALALAQPESKP